jgi:response regulator RpfG family c-di-GMP phosphodiesterase
VNGGTSGGDTQLRSAAIPETAVELLAAARERIERASPGDERLLGEMVTRLRTLSPAQGEAVDALVEITHYFLATKCAAMESAAATVLKARELGDAARICAALRVQTWAATDAAEFGTAISSGIESVTLAEATGLLPAAASAWNILGCAFLCMNQHRLAHACFERCIATGGEAESVREYHECAAGNLFTSHLMQGDLREATSTATWLAGQLEHAKVRDDTVSRAEQALLHCSIAEAMIVIGDFHFAETQIARVKEYLGPTRVRSRASETISFLEALMRLARGESASLEVIGTFGSDPSDITSMHAVIAVYESIGQYDKALQLLRTLWDRSKSRYLSSAEMKQRILDGGIPLSLDNEDNNFDQRTIRITSKAHERIDSLLQLAISASTTAGYAPTRIFRVSKLARIVAAAVGFTEAQVELIDLAAKFYDIGMVAVNPRLLSRQAALTPPERALVSEHAKFGADLLSAANLELLAPCIPVARFHHERWDGGGPLGMKDREIPVEVALISLCDTFDALMQPRPWRSAYSRQGAVAEIQSDSGKKFDPTMCDIFLATVSREMALHADFLTFLEEDAHENETVVLRKKAERILGLE